MSENNLFKTLLMIARPAAGKSEIIDYLRHTSIPERKNRFHIGSLDVFDDFPMLWAWFEEDRILEDLGHSRLHTDQNRNFKKLYFWDVLIRRICLEYEKKRYEIPNYHQTHTAILEFSRGKAHGGFRRAFQHLSRDILSTLVVMYIDVSWKESFRKNRERFNPDRPHSILEHGLTDIKMKKLYRESDWEELSAVDEDFLNIQGVRVPYVVFDNEDDVTTERGDALGQRLDEALGVLWRGWFQKGQNND